MLGHDRPPSIIIDHVQTRAVFWRVAVRRRFEQAMIELQLDHVDDTTRAIYDRGDSWDERVELMQFWADKIDQMRDAGRLGTRSNSKVIHI
jgi:hypothetical protein